ncbi:MAG: hypothetical protein KA821_02730 [Chitinophagaceae bacterium]|nr:hypothetical protein [Chitinophagaceae bacterium]
MAIHRTWLLASIFAAAIVEGNAQAPACNCSENLDTLIAKTELNYAGFPAKVNADTKAAYQQLKTRLKEKAVVSNTPVTCFPVLREYVKFFYDSHFQLSYYNEQDINAEYINLSVQETKDRLRKKGGTPPEGIWINQDSSLKVAVLLYPDKEYKAIVLESKNPKIQPGLVYMTIAAGKRGLTVKYHNGLSSTDYPIKIKGNLLQGWSDELFGRIYPVSMSAAELREQQTWRNGNHGLDFYKLSQKTAVLKIPSFTNNDDRIAALITRNDFIIRSTENLIVDLTGNGGGSTGWISFLGYFMTNPVMQENGYVRVSPENVKLKLADVEPYVTNPIPPDYQKYFPDSILNSYKKAYAELPTTTAAFYPAPGVVFPLDSITVNPKKIALVVDNLCGSSTEYFFFLSKKSAKTVTYGSNTFGMMDYEGASPTTLPFPAFRLAIPIVKSSWTDSSPIDKTGFKPDVLLSKTDPAKWIDYIRQQLEK